MDPRAQDDARRRRSHDERQHGVVRGEGDEISAGEHQSDRYGNEAILDDFAPARAAKALPDFRDGVGQQARGRAHRPGRHDRAGEAGHLPADQADDEDVRPRRRLGEREQLRELRTGHPAVHLDDIAVHLGQHGDHSAHRDQREEREIQRQLRERAHRLLHAAAATLRGAAITRNAPRGIRSSATPTKAATANSAIAERSRGLDAILTPIATTRPAAAAEMPRNAAEIAGSSPYWVNSAPSTRMIANGADSRPRNAAIAPGAPRKRVPTHTAMLTMLGPGRTWHRLSISLNSSSLSQRRSSTSILRAQGMTPPKPEAPTCVKRTNSSLTLGRTSLTASSSRADALRRTPWRDAGSRGAYTLAWSRCSSARASPALHAGLQTIAARGSRTNAAACAGARAGAGRA